MARPSPKSFTVSANRTISPNMRRVTLHSETVSQFPDNAEGGYIKLMFPQPEQDKPLLRTYTICNLDRKNNSMDVDFVIHEDGGPASLWSEQAAPGDTINISGPGPGKPLDLTADWFLIAGDMTSLPAIRTNIRSLPKDSRGYLVLEIISEDDKQALDIELSELPPQLEIRWLVNLYSGIEKVLSKAVCSLDWLEGEPAIWIAAELDEVLKARSHLKTMPDIKSGRMYISSYWQHGMTEDRHKAEKQKRL